MANVSFRFGDRNWYSTQVVPYYAYPHYSDIMVFHNEMFEAGICPSDVVDSSTRNFGLIRQVKLIG